VITSPPYFRLRDYGHRNQLGLEPNVDAWVRSLVEVCRLVARVLKPSGSLWLNVADQFSSHTREGAPRKSLLLGPERLAVALSRDGWIIRNRVIWAKTNPMPSSTRDRLSCGHETVLLLVRSPRYFFDLDLIREPLITPAMKRRERYTADDSSGYRYLPESVMPTGGTVDDNRGLNGLKDEGQVGHPLGKNPGDVWTLATAEYRGAHFATFPLGLIERPLLASCPEKVCAGCGVPWVRELVKRDRDGDSEHHHDHDPDDDSTRDHDDGMPSPGSLKPGCDCGAGTEPGIVLDPFMGAGTTALAAEMHGRRWMGIELNPRFARLAERRLAGWRGRRGARS